MKTCEFWQAPFQTIFCLNLYILSLCEPLNYTTTLFLHRVLSARDLHSTGLHPSQHKAYYTVVYKIRRNPFCICAVPPLLPPKKKSKTAFSL